MVAYKKKNIWIGAMGRLMLPEALWTRQMIIAWIGCFLTVVTFNLLWCWQTTFHPLAFVSTWLNALLLATVMAFPTVVWRRSWPQLLVMLLVDLFMLANLMYCHNYFNAIPAASYELAHKLLDTPGVISSSFRWSYVALPAIALLTFVVMNPMEKERKPNAVFYLLTGALLFLASYLSAMVSGGMTDHVDSMRGESYYASAG